MTAAANLSQLPDRKHSFSQPRPPCTPLLPRRRCSHDAPAATQPPAEKVIVPFLPQRKDAGVYDMSPQATFLVPASSKRTL